ncbi:Asp-tRNA(Asn)/Glu-tRNA(Gln) amidotransferase subunit GatB [Pseudobacteriovorax antillogorgiicola]|uniref:Aspartyl/glutamyl-tRNA(Asn/Gln) amidotransferase subunit B n=1 Tax=Pseudobacteriovorax antillogorgiicola TaxID=1513793 RepID=A0A1Y6B5B3_9BACT|nr:Asp-tRNA(Asn)/Glu-tRNA(Gln) amidotransferase subunit GatB [Pseudobacteriovorax antillogorgiicola]TCS59140.1 aspartyl/glutamyl-tRNA(Asn/Gln) amidotransferase subunit B [Pseudobacteriovorax antillogorgiicola]SME91280.1 aspartyl/glutamyl-tRNA(Asn/Gln) amidotransferase subunit B [Pseudobacteriovorax antillogorgiicola]
MNSQEPEGLGFLDHPLMQRFEPVIGLEVHCQLATKSKLFCNCSTEFGAGANHNTCPVCLGLPGTLPVLNRQAVDYAVAMGLAIEGSIQETSVFARKQYFYPDLPKGYQISQYDLPYCLGGAIRLDSGYEIQLTRIHIEEDAGKNVHGDNASYVDLNRAGIPLIEIVSEPVIRTPQEAVEYLKKLRTMARYLEISDGNMEEGSFRCDANVSVRARGQSQLGTRTEIKNLNSFKSIERAITYEIFRQIDVIDAGDRVIQQTLLFDTALGKTQALRSKEDSHDYRYFPDPDLGCLMLSKERIDKIRDNLPELPEAKAQRFQDQFSLSSYDATQLTTEKGLATYFEEVVSQAGNGVAPKLAANWTLTEVLRVLSENDLEIEASPISPTQLAELLNLISDGTISGKIAKRVFELMLSRTENPKKIVEQEGLVQISDESKIQSVIKEILDKNGAQVEEYLSGKDKVLGFFVGQVMKAFQGKCNPSLVNKILKDQLNDRRK